MSMNFQPPPPKTTSSGTIAATLLGIFVGIPVLLCLIGGVAVWGVAGFPGAVSKETSARWAWQRVIREKRKVDVKFANLILKQREKPVGAANFEGLQVWSEGIQLYQKVKDLADTTQSLHGPIPPDLLIELRSTEELERILGQASNPFANRGSPFGGGSVSTATSAETQAAINRQMAQDRLESEQRLARIQADQARRDQERVQRDQQMAALRLAEQQAREQREREMREQSERAMANLPRFTPQPFIPPPTFNQPAPGVNQPPPVFNQPQPQPGNPGNPQPAQPANEAPPGFPATDLAQVKPRDLIFVQAGEKWVEALVQSKRGKIIQVRSATGDVAAVTLERIRLKNEPTARPDSNVPKALQVAEGTKRPGKKDDEEEDDLLFVAKPSGEQQPTQPAAATPAQPAAVTPSKPAAPVAEYRVWTDDTGTFKVEAELISFEFDLVQLRRRSDGKMMSLRIEKLSAEDQKAVRAKFP